MSKTTAPSDPVVSQGDLLDLLDQDASQSFDSLAAITKASGDPQRLEILRVLQRDAFGVLELSRMFDMRQSGMSHHLKVLAKAGMVERRREGNSIYYRRVLPGQALGDDLRRAIFTSLDVLPLTQLRQEAIEREQLRRSELSQQFFTENSDKFRAQQDLIAEYEQYADSAVQLLQQLPLADNQVALELGPGEGQFLLPLAERYQRVIAVDNSSSMLQRAQQYVQLSNCAQPVEFIHGELTSVAEDLQVNCLVSNMVLHHLPAPAEFFQQAAKLLAPQGAVLITDLCHHDQAWVREACGDLWLGFTEEDLNQWSRAAGLTQGPGVYLALRNGFRIQVKVFVKSSADAP